MLTTREVSLKEINFSGRKTEKITHINTGVTNISPHELKLLPSAGGEPDLAQVSEVYPGEYLPATRGTII